jgi:hypothetical protein
MVPLSLSRLAHVPKATTVPPFGVGGIYAPADVVRYLLLGCSAVQVCKPEWGTLYLVDERTGERVWENTGMVASFMRTAAGGHVL